MRWKAQVRFGGRRRGNHRPKSRHGASPPTLLCPTSYGFRPGRRAQDAIEETRRFINPPGRYEWVIEGDVENCFGALHHGLLMEQVRGRVTDKRVLALIRKFLPPVSCRNLAP